MITLEQLTAAKQAAEKAENEAKRIQGSLGQDHMVAYSMELHKTIMKYQDMIKQAKIELPIRAANASHAQTQLDTIQNWHSDHLPQYHMSLHNTINEHQEMRNYLMTDHEKAYLKKQQNSSHQGRSHHSHI